MNTKSQLVTERDAENILKQLKPNMQYLKIL